MLKLPDGRAVLYQPNPLYNKMLEKQAANLFPEYRGLIPFQMRIDAASILGLFHLLVDREVEEGENCCIRQNGIAGE